MKLYLKTAAHPFIIGFMLFMMIGMSFAFAIKPDLPGTEEYRSMIGTLQMGKIGVFFVIMMGNLRLQQYKFFYASSCAKPLFTTAPIITGLAILLIYDAALAVIGVIGIGITAAADVLSVGSVSNACMIMVAATYGKKGLTLGFILPYMLYMFGAGVVKMSVGEMLLGQSIWSGVAIDLGLCAATAAAAIGIVYAWWKKGDRISQVNNNAVNIAGGNLS